MLTNQRKLLKDFNMECDKIQNSKISNNDYKKCYVGKMETFLKEFLKVQNNHKKKAELNNDKN